MTTMLADYGVQVGFQDNLHYFSSRGPREDGGMAPSAVAPGAAIKHDSALAAAGLPCFGMPGSRLRAGQWHVDGRTAVDRRRRAAHQRGEGGRRAVPARSDPAVALVERSGT